MMKSMNTSANTAPHPRTRFDLPPADVEQLTLLPAPHTPARFLLSKETRERGLRHVAEIREMLAARTAQEHSPRHDRAA
jgi:hypothetical protein